jgi:hypothetical protein
MTSLTFSLQLLPIVFLPPPACCWRGGGCFQSEDPGRCGQGAAKTRAIASTTQPTTSALPLLG